jgi:hypothetical protein
MTDGTHNLYTTPPLAPQPKGYQQSPEHAEVFTKEQLLKNAAQ